VPAADRVYPGAVVWFTLDHVVHVWPADVAEALADDDDDDDNDGGDSDGEDNGEDDGGVGAGVDDGVAPTSDGNA